MILSVFTPMSRIGIDCFQWCHRPGPGPHNFCFICRTGAFYHTERSIDALNQAFDSFLADLHVVLGNLNDGNIGDGENRPKIHAIFHLIRALPQRGLCQFHSTAA